MGHTWWWWWTTTTMLMWLMGVVQAQVHVEDGMARGDVSGRVAWPKEWKGNKEDAVLRLRDPNGRERVGWIQGDDTFCLHHVPTGRHVLTVQAPSLWFPAVVVDVKDGRDVTYTLRDHDAPSQRGTTTLGPSGTVDYYETHTSWWSVRTWRRHPWMIGVGLLVVSLLILPMILDYVDPEGYRAAQPTSHAPNVSTRS